MVPLTPAARATTPPSFSHAANFASTELHSSENNNTSKIDLCPILITSDNYCNIANNVHPITKIPLVANLAIKSHYGPVPVPKNCVVPVPTEPPSSSSSRKFSYEHVVFSILETSSQEELAKYHHQTVGSSPKSTFLRSIWDHPLQWKTFPGLSYELIHKHLPPSMATYQGHMIRKQSGYNYTRSNRLGILDARKDVHDMFPTEQVCAITEDDMFVFVMLGNAHANTLYTDLTGQFPVESYDCMNYIFIAYVYKLNAILLRSMKRREDTNMVTAFRSAYAELKEKSHTPNLHVITTSAPKPSRRTSSLKRSQSRLRRPTTTESTHANRWSSPPSTTSYPPWRPRTKPVPSNYGAVSSHICNEHSPCSVHRNKTTILPPTRSSMAPLTGMRRPWPR